MTNLKPRTAEIVIYQGDDLAHLADLRRKAEAAQRAADLYRSTVDDGTARAGDDAPSAAAEKAAYDAFVDEAAERAVIVRLQAIGRRRFRTLVTEHPAREVDAVRTGEDGEQVTVRETHPDDAAYGVNVDTFPDALLNFVDEQDDSICTIVSPEFASAAKRRAFLEDEMADGDFEQAWVTAYFLNRSPGADPKARRYSTDSPRSIET